MFFNATFNNILAISWRSVLLVKETGVPGENHRSAVNWDEDKLNSIGYYYVNTSGPFLIHDLSPGLYLD